MTVTGDSNEIEVRMVLTQAFNDYVNEAVASGRPIEEWKWTAAVRKTQIERADSCPLLPSITSPAAPRLAGCAAVAHWLYEPRGNWTQDPISGYLNEQGQTTVRGLAWTQSSVSYLMRTHDGGRQ